MPLNAFLNILTVMTRLEPASECSTDANSCFTSGQLVSSILVPRPDCQSLNSHLHRIHGVHRNPAAVKALYKERPRNHPLRPHPPPHLSLTRCFAFAIASASLAVITAGNLLFPARSDKFKSTPMLHREYNFWVYILASRSRNLYVGMTNNVLSRTTKHREGVPGTHTTRYQSPSPGPSRILPTCAALSHVRNSSSTGQESRRSNSSRR